MKLRFPCHPIGAVYSAPAAETSENQASPIKEFPRLAEALGGATVWLDPVWCWVANFIAASNAL